jgi:hypothetical protein
MLILAVLFSGLTLIAPVLACGGGATDTVEALLARSDIAIKAEPVAVDALRQNGVLRVESYLYGSGPEYVLFSLNDPFIIEGILEGSPAGTCNFISEALIPGETGYYFLERRPDGAYVSTTYIQEPEFYVFDDPDSVVRYYTRSGDPFIEHILDEAAFVDLIITTGNSELTAPDTAWPYPRTSPMKITTADGKHYLLPVDQDVPLEVTRDLQYKMLMMMGAADGPLWNERYFNPVDCRSGEDCRQVSPDGLNSAEFWVQDEITWWMGKSNGQAFLFSSTSDAIAVWNGNRLTVHTIGYSRPDMRSRQSQAIQFVILTAMPEQALGQAAWSPDGRLLAYSDSAGLWLLDVFTPDAEPTLLLAAEGDSIPIARAFSPMGRYLHLTQGSERFTLDRISGERWPDGVISPDDRLLLAFDTSAEVFPDMLLCPLVMPFPTTRCDTVGRTTTFDAQQNSIHFDQFIQAAWRDSSSFLVSVCWEDDLTDCVVDRHYNHGLGWSNSIYYAPGFAFDYQPQHDNLVIVQPDNKLLINGESVDLSASLAAPIIRAEWLPSLFYQR